jgi:hypothetical protein
MLSRAKPLDKVVFSLVVLEGIVVVQGIGISKEYGRLTSGLLCLERIVKDTSRHVCTIITTMRS